MNIYQVYYTRRGKGDADLGWGIWGKSDGVSNDVCEYIRGSKANEAVFVAGKNYKENMLALETDDLFAYVMNSDYNAMVLDGRGNMFFHALALGISDLYTLLKRPESVLGISNRMFASDNDVIARTDKSVKKLPVLQALETDREFDEAALRQKYGLTDEKMQALLTCVAGSIEHKSALCIVLPEGQETLRDRSREIMYCIYCALPYDLRVLVRFSTLQSQIPNIYFSTEKNLDYYFDIESGRCRADDVGVEGYSFINAGIAGGEKRETLYQRMTQFSEKAFETAKKRKAITLKRVQIAYEAITGDISNAELPQKLMELLRTEADNHTAGIDDYCAQLVERMFELHMTDKLKNQMNVLMGRFRETKSERFKAVYAQLFIVQYCEEISPHSFEMLYKARKRDKESYEYIVQLLVQGEDKYQKYLSEYYAQYIYEKAANSIADLEREKDHQPIFANNMSDVDTVFLRKYMQLALKEMENLSSNEELYDYFCARKLYLSKIFKQDTKKTDIVLDKCREAYWRLFDLQHILYVSCKQYKDMSSVGNIGEEEKIVLRFVSVLEETNKSQSDRCLYKALIKGEFGSNPSVVQNILKEIRLGISEDQGGKLPVNLLLTLNYVPGERRINFEKFERDVQKGNLVEKNEREMASSLHQCVLLEREQRVKEDLKEDISFYLKKNKREHETLKYRKLEILSYALENRQARDREKSKRNQTALFREARLDFIRFVIMDATISFSLFFCFRMLGFLEAYTTISCIGMGASVLVFVGALLLNLFLYSDEDGEVHITEALGADIKNAVVTMVLIILVLVLMMIVTLIIDVMGVLYVLIAINFAVAFGNCIAGFFR